MKSSTPEMYSSGLKAMLGRNNCRDEHEMKQILTAVPELPERQEDRHAPNNAPAAGDPLVQAVPKAKPRKSDGTENGSGVALLSGI